MTVYYLFEEGSSGRQYGFGDNKSRLSADVTNTHADIHVHEPQQVDGETRCKLTGDTYPAKETIKSTEYSRTGYGWFGEFWAAYPTGLHELIPALVKDGYSVSSDQEPVQTCDGLADFHKVILMGQDNPEYFVFERGPEGDNGLVSESWAESAAELGNWDSVEAFCDRFGLEPMEDEKLMDKLGVGMDDDRVEFATSGQAKGR